MRTLGPFASAVAAFVIMAGAAVSTSSEAAQRPGACANQRWLWRKAEIPTPTGERPMEVAVPGGKLVGVDRGEFGGALQVHDLTGRVRVLSHDNVRAILPLDDGALVLFGMAHRLSSRAYAMRVSLRDETWSLTFVGVLPAPATAIDRLADGSFAVLSDPGFSIREALTVIERGRQVSQARCVQGRRVR